MPELSEATRKEIGKPFGGKESEIYNALWVAIHAAADEANEHVYDIMDLPRASFCVEVGTQLAKELRRRSLLTPAAPPREPTSQAPTQ